MNSPEGRLLTRYAVTVVLAVIALLIATRTFPSGVLGWIVIGAGIIGTRVVYAAPLRFAHRQATPRLTLVWYLFLVEIIVGAIAFTLVFDRRGSAVVAIGALALAIVFEIVATTIQHAEYERLGLLLATVPPAPPPDDLPALAGEADGPANQAMKNALAEVFERIPTIVRAYLVKAADDRLVLALRFAYPWADEDAVRSSRILCRRMFPAEERLAVVALNGRTEARVRSIAPSFYARAERSAAPLESPSSVTESKNVER